MKNFNKRDHKELSKLGIKTLMDEPKNVKVVLRCVRHTEFHEFLNKFNGVLYDYRTPLELDN